MSAGRQRLGRLGERIARSRLQAKGYSILDTNYRAKAGEIDLVARKDGVLVFVEVRTRTRAGAALGLPEESITPRKKTHLVETAQEYLQQNNAEGEQWRIDLVAIEIGEGGRLERLDVVENSVEV